MPSRSPFAEPPVELADVEALHSTSKALLCAINGLEIWVPFSQIAAHSEVKQIGDFGILIVTSWWYNVSGLAENPRAQENVLPSSLPEAARLYRRLIFEFHPDRNAGAGETARALNQLWQAVLTDLRNAKNASS